MEESAFTSIEWFSSAAMPPENQLLHAIRSRDFILAQRVVKNVVDFNTPRILGKSFLRHAGENNDRQMCELLVRNGSNPNEVNGKHRYSLLHHAAASSNYGLANILLAIGADANSRTSFLATPLHFAAKLGLEYLALRLLENGADINSIDHRNKTPLDYAMRHGKAGMGKLLIRKHCTVTSLNTQTIPDEVVQLIAECGQPRHDPT